MNVSPFDPSSSKIHKDFLGVKFWIEAHAELSAILLSCTADAPEGNLAAPETNTHALMVRHIVVLSETVGFRGIWEASVDWEELGLSASQLAPLRKLVLGFRHQANAELFEQQAMAAYEPLASSEKLTLAYSTFPKPNSQQWLHLGTKDDKWIEVDPQLEPTGAHPLHGSQSNLMFES